MLAPPLHGINQLVEKIRQCWKDVSKPPQQPGRHHDQYRHTHEATHAKEKAALKVYPIDLPPRSMKIKKQIFNHCLPSTVFIVTLDAINGAAGYRGTWVGGLSVLMATFF